MREETAQHELGRVAPRAAGPTATTAASWTAARELSADSAVPLWAPAARVLVLAATDAAAVAAACTVAWLAWAGPVLRQPAALYTALAPLLGLFVLNYAAGGLYPGFGLGAVETLRRLTQRSTLVFIALAATIFAFKIPAHYSRATMMIAWLLCLLSVPLARYLVLSRLSRTRWWGVATVVIGDGAQVDRIVDLLRSAVSIGYRPVAVIRQQATPNVARGELVRCVGGLEAAPVLAERGVGVALLAGASGDSWAPAVASLQKHFRHVVLLREGDDLPVETVAVRNLGGVLGIELRNNLLLYRNRLVKRTIDVTVGAVALLVSLPLIAAAAILVRLVDGGPAFFSQVRTGRGGRRITVWKLRSMRRDAETRLEEHLRARPDLREAWQVRLKLPGDPRIIPVIGTAMRRLSIDELPQLLSVLRGDMSLVGPRPFPDYHTVKFPEQFRQLRQSVRPGLTGLWQVMVRSEGGLEEQREFDSYYIRNWSMWMDVYVLAKTFGAVISGRGAY